MSDRYLNNLSSYKQNPIHNENMYSGKCIIDMYESNCNNCGECVEYGIKGKE